MPHTVQQQPNGKADASLFGCLRAIPRAFRPTSLSHHCHAEAIPKLEWLILTNNRLANLAVSCWGCTQARWVVEQLWLAGAVAGCETRVAARWLTPA